MTIPRETSNDQVQHLGGALIDFLKTVEKNAPDALTAMDALCQLEGLQKSWLEPLTDCLTLLNASQETREVFEAQLTRIHTENSHAQQATTERFYKGLKMHFVPSTLQLFQQAEEHFRAFREAASQQPADSMHQKALDAALHHISESMTKMRAKATILQENFEQATTRNAGGMAL
jgi:hypothetical protein